MLTLSRCVNSFVTVSTLVKVSSAIQEHQTDSISSIYIMKSGDDVHEWHCCVAFWSSVYVKVKPDGGFDVWWTIGNMFVHYISCLIQYFFLSFFFFFGDYSRRSGEVQAWECIVSFLQHKCRPTALQCKPFPLQSLICDQKEAYKNEWVDIKWRGSFKESSIW